MNELLVSRYHPLLVMLHWLIAVLIVALLSIGFFLAVAVPNTDPHKISILLIHMSAGMLVFALMAVRLIVRLSTALPADAATRHPALGRIASAVHYGFYLLVLGMAVSGLSTSILAGLNRSVFQGSGEPLPPSFAIYPTFTAHSYLAWLLLGLLVLHVIGALYHQFFLKDGLFRRMWFGRRVSRLSADAE
jgi:cytochrome b561